MDLKQRLVFCKKCENKKYGDTGIICSLTGIKPDFNNKCNDFILDEKQAQKMATRAEYANHEEKESKTSVWGVILIIFVVIRIIFRLLKD